MDVNKTNKETFSDFMGGWLEDYLQQMTKVVWVDG